MNQAQFRFWRIMALLGILIFIMLLLLSGSSIRLRAQEPAPALRNSSQTAMDNRLALRQAFLNDRQPAEKGAPTAATPCIGGTAAGYPCDNVALLAHMPLGTIGASSANDIWGWTDPLDGGEYALIGLNNGTGFVDISDPENPIYLGSLPSHTSSSSWRDIKVYANHAFVVSEATAHGMQVFDLTRLRNVASPPASFSEDAHYNGVSSSHNILINEQTGFAYIVGANGGSQSGCSGGLHMVNISAPTAPAFAGCFAADGYTHDAQCVIYNGPDLEHIGQEICFNANEDTVTIVDVSDKANPVQLSRTGYPGCTSTSNCYTHQAWLTEDQATLLVGDELDEVNGGLPNTRTYIWDISDLDAPPTPQTHDSPEPAIDHNLYVRGNLVYQANYRAGLRLLDVSDVAAGNLFEVGYFDIYPANNNPNFNAAWSNYPYFDSDVVIVSGIEQGLFVLRPNMLPDFRIEPSAVTLDICGNNSDSTTFYLESLYGFNSPVTLSVSGVPVGASAAFSTNPIQPSGSSEFTVSNTSASPGSYLLQVAGTDGSLTANEYLKLNISPGAVPILTAPLDNAINVSASPTLTWQVVPGASSYDVEIATDAGFSNIVYSAAEAGTSHTTAVPLNANTIYYWHVIAHNDCGAGTSTTFSFTTEAAAAMLSIEPANTEVPLGDTATVDVIVDDSSSSTFAVEIELSFDPTVVEVVSVQPGTCPAPDFVAQNTFDNANGTINYAATSLAPTSPCSNGTVIQITFRGLLLNTSPLNFTSSLLSNSNGIEIPAGTQSGTLQVVELLGTIEGTVNLQGRADNGGAEVCADDGGTLVCTLTDAAGNYSLDVAEGSHLVTVDMERYLDAEKLNVPVIAASTTSLQPVTCLGGDTNDDCVINILDLALEGGRFGSSCGDPGWDPRADINDDCTVNILDLAVTGGNFGQTCPVLWSG